MKVILKVMKPVGLYGSHFYKQHTMVRKILCNFTHALNMMYTMILHIGFTQPHALNTPQTHH